MLPIGQLLWLKELESYKKFPPLQAPETYNLSGIEEEMRKATASERITPAKHLSEASAGGPERVARSQKITPMPR